MDQASLPGSSSDNSAAPIRSAPRFAALNTLLFAGSAAIWLACAASFAARFHWMCELLTHFRMHYAVLLGISAALLCGVCRAWRRGLLVALTGLALGATLIPLYRPVPAGNDAPGPVWRLVSVNVHAESRAHDQFAEFLAESQPDVLIVLEVNDRWADQLLGLHRRFPHQKIVPQRGNFGLAVLSRFPLRETEVEWLSDRNPAIRTLVEVAPGEEWTVLAVHPIPPMSASMSSRRDQQIHRLAELVSVAPHPLVVAGDFNTTSWSPVFQDFVRTTGLIDSRCGFGNQPTWQSPLSPVGIAIDHALISPEVRVVQRRVGRHVGSDHRPIILDLRR